MKRLLLGLLSGIAAFVGGTHACEAGPILQLYLEGATYDTTSESWVISPLGSSGGAPFRLWAIGNVDGPGGKGTILDVKLSAVYDEIVGPLIIDITPSKTNGYNGFTDPSLASAATLLRTVTDGSTPTLGDGSSMPSHGEYGTGRIWQEFSLGDFNLTDSPYADFSGSTDNPTPSKIDGVQINVYDISVRSALDTGFGEHPFDLHFDLYDHVESANHATFAPFSHDASGGGGIPDGTVTVVPEPSSLSLLLVSVLCSGLGIVAFRRKRIATNAAC